jgi:hypothetical protein
VFHGWLFDVTGKCLQTPAEPEGSRLCESVRQRAYPVIERSGIVFAWLGDAEPSAFPHFDCFTAPDAYTFAFKGYWDCNWLQALEVGIDPAHASYLHRYFEDEDTATSYGKQFRGKPSDSELPISKVLREFDRPDISVERTDYGIRLVTLRRIDERQTHGRSTHILFPQTFVIPMNAEMTITQWHVPVDDYGCYWYSIFTSFTTPVDKKTMREQRLKAYPAPDYKPIFNRANGWGFSAEQQAKVDVHRHGLRHQHPRPIRLRVARPHRRPHQGAPRHDRQGNRSLSAHPARGDREALARREGLMMLNEAEAASLTGPPAIDGIGATGSWDDYYKQADAARRNRAPWSAKAA